MDPCAFTFPTNGRIIAFNFSSSTITSLADILAIGDTAFAHLADYTIADIHYNIRNSYVLTQQFFILDFRLVAESKFLCNY